MNTRRYLSYRRALRQIGALEEGHLRGAPGDRPCGHGAEVLREVAEDLLLTREPASGTHDLLETASVTLMELTGKGALSSFAAEDIWRALCGSGPQVAATPLPTTPLVASPR